MEYLSAYCRLSCSILRSIYNESPLCLTLKVLFTFPTSRCVFVRLSKAYTMPISHISYCINTVVPSIFATLVMGATGILAIKPLFEESITNPPISQLTNMLRLQSRNGSSAIWYYCPSTGSVVLGVKLKVGITDKDLSELFLNSKPTD